MPVSTTGTLVRPPRKDPSRSPIENVLELTQLDDIGPDIFTNTRPLWHPPGARGIYGGAAIAQCLAAAQRTVPANYFIHSMHCYFVLAGDSTIPVLYNVERVREGRSFATRTVQALQRGRCIFTTTLSFMRAGSGGDETVDHASALPEGVSEWLNAEIGMEAKAGNGGGSVSEDDESVSPFEVVRMDTLNNAADEPASKRARHWIRCRGTISGRAGPQAHLSALAYMSDSHFIGTVARVHNLWRFGRPSSSPSTTVKGSVTASSSSSTSPSPSSASPSPSATASSATSASSPPSPSASGPAPVAASTSVPDNRPTLAQLEARENAHAKHGKTIGMMVSLDHTIFFHHPQAIRADEWLFAEMESPWAGDGRGLVFQKIWNRRGELVATCVQEGLVRLVQGGEKVKL